LINLPPLCTLNRMRIKKELIESEHLVFELVKAQPVMPKSLKFSQGRRGSLILFSAGRHGTSCREQIAA